MTFEHRRQPLLPRRAFTLRVFRFGGFALGIIVVSLGIGILGYHFIAGMDWIESVLNAAMILTGMGPVSTLHGDAAMLFASFYALFSGIVFLMSVGVFLAPIAHRLYHRFHLEYREEDENE